MGIRGTGPNFIGEILRSQEITARTRSQARAERVVRVTSSDMRRKQ